MRGARSVILVVALAAALTVMLVFRVRVFVASGKLILALLAIALIAWVLWPKRER